MTLLPMFAASLLSYSLVVEWETNLGGVDASGPRYYLAACPGGGAYLTVSRETGGRLAKIDAGGRTVFDKQDERLGRVQHTACDAQERFYGWRAAPNTDRRVVVVEGRLSPVKGELQVTENVVLVTPKVAVPTDDGILVRDGLFNIHRLDARGEAVSTLRHTEKQLPPRDASLAWDRARNRWIIAPRHDYVFLVYGPDDQLLLTKPRDDQGFTPAYKLGKPHGDEVDAVVALPDGRALTRIRKVRWEPSSTSPTGEAYGGHVYYELFDRDLNLLATGIKSKGYGLLKGVDWDGNLYFYNVQVEHGIRIFKVRLEPKPAN